MLAVKQLSPDSWIASHTGTPATAPISADGSHGPQTLESVLAALKSEGPGSWVVEVMRRGCDDVLEVEILSTRQSSDTSSTGGGRWGASGAGGGDERLDVFGAAAIQKNLWQQLVQASEPKKANWQAKAARVCMYVYMCVCLSICVGLGLCPCLSVAVCVCGRGRGRERDGGQGDLSVRVSSCLCACACT